MSIDQSAPDPSAPIVAVADSSDSPRNLAEYASLETPPAPFHTVEVLTAAQPFSGVVRYGWTGEEKAIVGTLLLAPALLFLLLHGLVLAAASLACWAAAGFLVRMGRNRKDTSALTARWAGTELTVQSRGKVGSSSVDLVDVRAVATKRFGSDQCLILAADGDHVKVPMRLAQKEPWRRLVLEVAKKAAVSDEAKRLLATMDRD